MCGPNLRCVCLSVPIHARTHIAHQSDVLKKMQSTTLDTTLGDQGDARQLVQVLVKLLTNVAHEVTVQQFALTRIDDILTGKYDVAPSESHEVAAGEVAQRAKLFQDASGALDMGPFMRAMRRDEDLYCKRCACVSLARLLVVSVDGVQGGAALLVWWRMHALSYVSPLVFRLATHTHLHQESPNTPVDDFISWTCEQLQQARPENPQLNGAMRAAVAGLNILLQRMDARYVFAQHGGIGMLTRLLKSSGANAQLLYELTFCLWTLSYCEEVPTHTHYIAPVPC